MSKRENIGIIKHTKTILCSKNRIYCVRKWIWFESREGWKIWYRGEMHSRTSEHKLEVQIDHKSYYFCCTTEKHHNDMSRLCPAWTFTTNTQVNCLLSDQDKQPYKDHLCIFRALTMYLHGHSNLDAHTSQLFTEFISKSGYNPNTLRGVAINDLPLVEGIVERNLFIYDFDIQKENIMEK